MFVLFDFFFFFKQKTAYEMRISDWSSDVCSSDLWPLRKAAPLRSWQGRRRWSSVSCLFSSSSSRCRVQRARSGILRMNGCAEWTKRIPAATGGDRKSVVSGKSVSVRVALGGLRIIKKKKSKNYNMQEKQRK